MRSLAWHTLSLPEIEKELSSDVRLGLREEEAKSRRRSFGPNELPRGKAESFFTIFLQQFQSPLIYVLLGAGIVVFFLGKTVDAAVILFVVVFNSIVGSIQEGRAQNTLASLQKLAKTAAVVVREGKELIIPDTEVVPGDLIIIQEGERTPADARIIEAHNLRVDESTLTGESLPVHKEEKTLLKKELPTPDQINMIFKGTYVVGGNGKAIVVATGLNSVIGKISQSIALIDTEIPLKTEIRNLSKIIVLVVAVLSALLLGVGLAYGNSITEMFSTVVSLAVSVIPEGLPIVITVVLASGVSRMAKKNALVKRLHAVEALGQAKVIAVDKTGTLTKNEMIVKQVFVNGKTFEVQGSGYDATGEIRIKGKAVYPLNHPELVLAAKIGALASDARLGFSEKNKTWIVGGDPTEAAMLVFARKAGVEKEELEKEMPKIGEKPFDYRTKYHLASYRLEGEFLDGGRSRARQFVVAVGAPEVILSLSKKIFVVPTDSKESGGIIISFTKEMRTEVETAFHRMSQNGLRVVALSFYETLLKKGEVADDLEIENLNFVGLFGIADSIRPEVKRAVEMAKEAGIRVVMITGDHKITATAVAKEVGILSGENGILTGEEIKNLTEEQLSKRLSEISVFARVTPEDKLKIINGYKRRGEIVAMTGDGVNDAPSLVAADLGIAMGKIGTEVAKEASDIVLLDDNFGNIISAVEEGRNIYKTIKKVILYLFSTSAGEFLTITVAIFLKYPLPLLPAQIIWLNLVTDTFLDVGLAMEPKETDLVRHKAEKSGRLLIDKLMIQRMPGMALTMMLGTLLIFSLLYKTDLAKALTMSLTTLAVFQWFNAWNCRSDHKSIFRMNPFSNKFLIAATFMVILLQMFAVYNPAMNKILHTTPLLWVEWFTAIVIASSVIFVEELRKFGYRRLGNHA